MIVVGKRKDHTFTITVSANAALPRRLVAREIRSLVTNQCNWLNEDRDGDTVIVKTRSVA